MLTQVIARGRIRFRCAGDRESSCGDGERMEEVCWPLRRRGTFPSCGRAETDLAYLNGQEQVPVGDVRAWRRAGIPAERLHVTHGALPGVPRHPVANITDPWRVHPAESCSAQSRAARMAKVRAPAPATSVQQSATWPHTVCKECTAPTRRMLTTHRDVRDPGDIWTRPPCCLACARSSRSARSDGAAAGRPRGAGARPGVRRHHLGRSR